MWKRSELKRRAKRVLKGSYWKAFLVSLVLAFTAGGNKIVYNFNLGNLNLGSSNEYSSYNRHGSSLGDAFSSFNNPSALLVLLIGILIFSFLLFSVIIAFRIFVGYPFEVGGRRFFIQSAQGNVDLNDLGFAFNRVKYMDIIKTMLWKALLNFLWYLAFFIPGIVKHYAYMMVPYILADNPNIGYRRAVELSNRMTKGHKFRIFILELSFIGWYLLGILAFLIGVLFVVPYQNATMAELYISLRHNALESNLCTYDELNLIPLVNESSTDGYMFS